jgi:hypothetical protein
VEFETQGQFSASASRTSAGTLILVSKRVKEGFDLLLVEQIEVRGRVQTILRDSISRSKTLQGLDAISLRQNLSSDWGAFMTSHIFHVLDLEEIDDSDVVSSTAWKYASLTAWGETSAARELALRMKIPVHTIHSRLRLARQRGILPSPGAGSRLGS